MNSFAFRARREMLLALSVVHLAWSLFLHFTKGLKPTGTALSAALLLPREFHEVAPGLVFYRVPSRGAGLLQPATRTQS